MRPIRNSAKAIILRGDRLLAIKLRDDEGDWYTLPGGGQHHGETLHETVKRECSEETAVEVEVGDLLFIREYIGAHHEFANFDAGEHQVEFMFLCKIADDAEPCPGPVMDTMQEGVEWLEIPRLDSYRLYPLALRPLIRNCDKREAPIYLGDIN